jgi:regulator of G-protein signaling
LRGARSNQDSHHRRPSSLTASESDVYTKIIEHDKHEKKHSSSHSVAGASSWGQSFELLLNDQNGLKIFAEFLKKEFSGEKIDVK